MAGNPGSSEYSYTISGKTPSSIAATSLLMAPPGFLPGIVEGRELQQRSPIGRTPANLEDTQRSVRTDGVDRPCRENWCGTLEPEGVHQSPRELVAV